MTFSSIASALLLVFLFVTLFGTGYSAQNGNGVAETSEENLDGVAAPEEVNFDGGLGEETDLPPSEDDDGVDQGVVIRSTIWKNRNIPVCWERSRPQKHNLVRSVAAETWSAHSKLNFVGWGVCSSSSKGIRIQAADAHPHVKGLGNQLNGKPNGMVLNFWFNKWSRSCRTRPDQCIKVIAVHEFGHAIGMAHEQNRDDAPAWCREKRQGSDGDWKVTIYDPNSIMNYCTKDYWTRTSGTYLSDRDIETVRILYGRKTGGQGGCSKYNNRDVAGPNLAFHHNTPESACCGICRSTRNCRAYAWNNYIGGTCWLKRGTKLYNNKGVRAGILRKGCSSQCSKYNNKDVAGRNLAFHHNKKESECCGLCKRTSGCKAYAWNNYKGGTCWLKRGTVLYDNRGVKAGVVQSGCDGAEPEECSKHNGKDVSGPNLAYFHGQPEDSCCDLCRSTPKCKAYAWNDYKDGTCYLKESTTLFDNEDAKAGVLS